MRHVSNVSYLPTVNRLTEGGRPSKHVRQVGGVRQIPIVRVSVEIRSVRKHVRRVRNVDEIPAVRPSVKRLRSIKHVRCISRCARVPEQVSIEALRVAERVREIGDCTRRCLRHPCEVRPSAECTGHGSETEISPLPHRSHARTAPKSVAVTKRRNRSRDRNYVLIGIAIGMRVDAIASCSRFRPIAPINGSVKTVPTKRKVNRGRSARSCSWVPRNGHRREVIRAIVLEGPTTIDQRLTGIGRVSEIVRGGAQADVGQHLAAGHLARPTLQRVGIVTSGDT